MSSSRALWFWRRRFLNDPTPFLQLSPLRSGPGFYFEQFRIPFTQGKFVPSLIEIGMLVLKKIFKIVSVFLLFPYYLPLEYGVALHMNKSDSPLPKDDLCQLWLQLAQRF
jgi:hypothetical protein